MTTTAPAVQADGLTKRYSQGRAEEVITAVDNLDLDVASGTITAVLGPNGAGKSTTLEMLIGLRTPTSGRARLFGEPPVRVRTRFGAMLQDCQAPEALTVAESVDLVRHYYPSPLPLSEILARADLTDKARRRVGQLSGGQQQRLSFAIAIAGDPDLLFLDEPTAALDVHARHRFWDQVRELNARGRTIMLSTHNMAEAQALADRVVLIAHGRIIADGTPTEVTALTATKTIRLRTDAGADVLAALPGVQRVQADPDGDPHRFVVHGPHPEAALRALFASAASVTDLTVVDADLESAFVDLVARPTPATAGLRPKAATR